MKRRGLLQMMAASGALAVAPRAGAAAAKAPDFGWAKPEIAKRANFMKGKGCSYCNRSGYRGRMAIYELMNMTSQVRELTFKGASTQDIRKLARKQGMRTLYEDGMIKALKGLTTIDEVLRITHREGMPQGG